MRSTATAWPPRASDHPGLVRAHADLLDWRLIVDEAGDSAESENVVIRTGCEAFDGVTLPRPAGHQLLLQVSRGRGPVPSLIPEAHTTLLVQAGTGQVLGDPPDVQIRSGPRVNLVLPPSPGVRWDTPPWSPARPEPLPLPLLDGAQPLTALWHALRLCNRPCRGAPPPPGGAPAGRTPGIGQENARGGWVGR
ncbi:hypothetical protein ACIO3O_34530 [Streptomyces sp. NPDC087440]|uniref:hypothetical protein n=1 Tax=Streptomyces sp. NPDC087440 TaxID=3365790 RepID=UPI00380850AA